MFALHALWRNDQKLALWAEDVRRWSGRTLPSGLAHPWAADADLVGDILRGMGPAYDWLSHASTPGSLHLQLPSRDDLVQPSPELRGPRWAVDVAGEGALTLKTFSVGCLVLEPEIAAQLLGELWPIPASVMATVLPLLGTVDVALGASLRWAAQVHDLAWRTVHAGEVLPSLTGDRAHWALAPGPAHWEEARRHAEAAPPLMRAELGIDPGAPDLVAAMIDAFVDAEMRLSLREMAPLLRPGRSSASTSPAAADAWLAALTNPSPIVAASSTELAELRRRLRVWHTSSRAPDAPVRLCLRLSEPLGPDSDGPHGEPSEQWTVELLLQVVEEPSQLVPAADVWGHGAAMAGVTRLVEDAPRLLSDEIARAAQIFPLLRFALREERPDTLALDRDQAVSFLQVTAAELTRAGIGVLIPAWWGNAHRLGVSLTARTSQPGAVATRGVLDRDVVVRFAWQAAIGDLRMSEDELRAMASSGQRLMRVRGQWVEVDVTAIQNALAFLEREGESTGSIADLIRIASEPPAVDDGLVFAGVEAEGWLHDLLAGAHALRVDGVRVPDWFTATLRPYQQRGLDWLHMMAALELGAVLADDMGLGKTLQLLALLAVEKDAGTSGVTLIVCPMTLVTNWQREAARFAPRLRVVVHHGSDRPDDLGELRDVDVVLTTYGLVQRDHASFTAVAWQRLVIDEAQTVKNSATKQARALRTLSARHRIALTGTPVENRLADLHAMLDQTNPGMFGSALAFKRRYSAPIERDGNTDTMAALHRLTAPFILRRHKSDAAIARELPEKQEFSIWCHLTAEQAGLYRGIVDDMLAKIAERKGIARRGVVLSALTRLKQVCDSPALAIGDGSPLADRSGKIARLEGILAEALAEGDKALCFTQYAALGTPLREHLSRRLGVDVDFLHGGIARGNRDAMITRFQGDAGPPVLLLSLKAGGTGLNLTAANHVIHIDRWWNPAVEDQATDRAFRIGQRKDVQVRRLVCVGTIEERIETMLDSKRNLAAVVNGGADDWLADLSTDTIAELVALSAEAQGDM